MCPVNSENNEAKLRAIYFSEKYGLVFGSNDLAINFDDMKKSCSRVGSIYEVPKVI